MDDIEKKLMRDMYEFIELLHVKVKILDDLKSRVIDRNPDFFTSEQLNKWEESNEKIAKFQLENLKNQISLL